MTAGAEIASWELAEKYYFDPSFGGALVPGQSNVFETTVDLSGIAFLTQPRHLSPVASRLRLYFPGKLTAEWNADYDPVLERMSFSNESVNYQLSSSVSAGAGHTFLKTSSQYLYGGSQTVLSGPSTYNQFTVTATYGHRNKRGLTVSTMVGYDANEGLMQYTYIEGGYNWDCCGLMVQYRRFAVGTITNDHQLRFTFLLSNIGSYGTLRKEDRMY